MCTSMNEWGGYRYDRRHTGQEIAEWGSARMRELCSSRDQIEVEGIRQVCVPIPGKPGVSDDAKEQDRDGGRECPGLHDGVAASQAELEIQRAGSRADGHAGHAC